jgi:replication-associated recombination protein RarA
MKKIKLASGVSLSIEDNVLNNMELLDALVAMDEGDWRAMSNTMNMILKPEEKKKLYDSLRNEQGVVPIDKIGDAFTEIFTALGAQGKN